MSTEIYASLIAVLLTMLGGVVGYFIKEYRDRLRPMVSVTSIGIVTKFADKIEVPPETIELIKSSFSIRDLSSQETLDHISQSLDNAKAVVRDSGWFIDSLDKLIDATLRNNAADLASNLSYCLNSIVVDRWLRILLNSDLVIPKPTNSDSPVQIRTYLLPDDDGCIKFDFPSAAPIFGMGFNKDPLLKEKCMRFVNLVERLDYDALRIFFEEVRQKMVTERMLAKDVLPNLSQLDNEHSRWEFQIFVANLGNTPFLIYPKGTVYIKAHTGASSSENCFLVIRKYNEKGEMARKDTVSPLIIRSESDAEISLITNDIQADMADGDAIRVAFTSKKAKARVKFTIEKSGFKRLMSTYSPWVHFVETE